MNSQLQSYPAPALPVAVASAPASHTPVTHSAFRFRIADYNNGLPDPNATQNSLQQHLQEPVASGSSLLTFSATPDPAPAPLIMHAPVMLIPGSNQPYHPMFFQQQTEPKQRKRKSRGIPEQSFLSENFQPASATADPQEPAPKKKRLVALKMSPEELKLEQARQIALRKEREAREKVQQELGSQRGTGSDRSPSADAPSENRQTENSQEPELTEEERRALEEEKARREAEAKAVQEELDKKVSEQREALMQAKLSHILHIIRGQNIPLDRFFHELCASKDPLISYQAARTFGPKSGPEIVDAIVERRPKVFESWLAGRAVEMYAKEREKLNKALRPDQRRAMKAIMTHMKSWGLQEEMEKNAPGIWHVLKSLEDVPQSE